MKIKKFKICTSRLEIRPLEISDFENWKLGLLGQSKPKNEFDRGRPNPKDITKKYFNNYVLKRKKSWGQDRLYDFKIFLKSTGECIGGVDIFIIRRQGLAWANFGYALFNQHWYKGYAFEAASAVAFAGFKKLKLHRLEAGTELANKRSLKLIKKLGFKKEGVRRQFIFNGNKWIDLVFYSALESDFGVKSLRT